MPPYEFTDCRVEFGKRAQQISEALGLQPEEVIAQGGPRAGVRTGQNILSVTAYSKLKHVELVIVEAGEIALRELYTEVGLNLVTTLSPTESLRQTIQSWHPVHGVHGTPKETRIPDEEGARRLIRTLGFIIPPLTAKV